MTRSPRLFVAALAAVALAALAGTPAFAAKPAGQPTISIEVNVDQEYFCGVPGFDAPGPDARVVLKRDGVVLQDLTVPVYPDRYPQDAAFVEAGYAERRGPLWVIPREGQRCAYLDDETSLCLIHSDRPHACSDG